MAGWAAYRDRVVRLRVLGAMALGAVVAALGALFLGEYEFDEMLPIVAGPLLGLVIAEIVVSIGRIRAWGMAVMVATAAAVAVVLAGWIDANGVESIKAGAYLSAGVAGLVAFVRAAPWGGTRLPSDAAPG